jgi:hypothetical protein
VVLPDICLLLPMAWIIFPGLAVLTFLLPDVLDEEGRAVAWDEGVDSLSIFCSSRWSGQLSNLSQEEATNPFKQSFSQDRLGTSNLNSPSFAHFHQLIPQQAGK